MPHKYDGNWSYFILSRAKKPGRVTPGRDFDLIIADNGDIDANSTVDGVRVQTGTANSNPNADPALDIITVDGRHYVGQFVNETPPRENKRALVLAGKFFQDPLNQPKAKGKRKATPEAQNEGDWVITKP
jgi:hypothetical protein